MIKKISIFICLFIISVSKTGAFLSSDLGLNLYKEIDKGIYNLEKTQLDFELKGGDSNGTLSESLNKYLETELGKGCIKPGLTLESLNKIVNGNLKTLENHFKKECYEENGISNSKIQLYSQAIKKYLINARNRSANKSNHIFEISKIGLYADGTTDNSPFDLIVDLQEIDKIIFGEELEYNGEEGTKDFLDRFEDDPFVNGNTDNGNNNGENGGENGGNNNGNANGENNQEDTIDNDENNTDISTINDGNNYICPQSNNQSGLNPDELNDLENDLENNEHELNFTFKTTAQGHLKLPDSNQININGLNPGNNNFFVGMTLNPNLNGSYNIVNDNNQWKCSPDSFFCITIEFITSEHKLLGYGKDKSIKDVIEMSNKHLKKGANTSLLQAKMGTNNFENILRDLDFPNMFHMGMVITTKSPPILNLERNEDKLVYNNSSKFYKNNLEQRYKNQGLDYKRKNDLTILLKKTQKQKNITDNAELSPAFSKIKENQLKSIQIDLEIENELQDIAQIRLINQASLKDFYEELTEYEKFIYELEEYTTNVLSYIKTLKNKPRGD